MDTTQNIKPGSKVYFGRTHGEKTLGEVIKVNDKSVKVRQLDARGSLRDYKLGTIWRVARSLVTLADDVPAPSSATTSDDKASLQRQIEALREENAKLRAAKVVKKTVKAPSVSTGSNCGAGGAFFCKFRPGVCDACRAATLAARKTTTSVTSTRTELAILQEICGIYSALSPENLTCDGEISRSAARRKATGLNLRLRHLFTELGRGVAEEDAYAERDRLAKVGAA